MIYRNIKNKEDPIALQKDQTFRENWGNTWGMRFNAAKCNTMRVSRTRDPRLFNYSLTGQVLEEVVKEGVLVEAYKGTRRKHNMKFRQIGHTTS